MTLWYCEDELGAAVVKSNKRPKTAIAIAPDKDVRKLTKTTTTDEHGTEIIEIIIDPSKVTQATADDQAKLAEEATVNMRTARNSILTASDWTQMSDSPLTPEKKTEWATYRQELRDLPANTPDPMNITWPTKPE